MIAPLTCFHRNPEMTSHCSITFIYCRFWGSGSGRLILLSSSYKYYLSLRVRAYMSVCVCVFIYYTCHRHTHNKQTKRALIFVPTAYEVPQSWLDWCQCGFSLIQSCVALPLRSFGSASRDLFLLLRIRVALLSFLPYTAWTVKRNNVPAISRCYMKTIPDKTNTD